MNHLQFGIVEADTEKIVVTARKRNAYVRGKDIDKLDG